MQTRILHVVTQMNRGGLETTIMNYYRHINRDIIQFDFLTHRQGEKDYDAEILTLGGNIYKFPNLNPFSFAYRKQLDNFFKIHDEYDIIHCHLDCLSSIPLRYAKKAGKYVRIAHSHTSMQEKDLKYPLKIFYKKRIPAQATHYLACSKKAGQWMFGDKDTFILKNAIPTKDYCYNKATRDEYRKILKIENMFVIGHVGNFTYAKNHKFLIEIFCRLHEIMPNSVLILAGLGKYESEVKELIKTLKLSENIIMLGQRNDIPELLQCFDVLCFPSHYEGLPVTLIEAQAAGLPCVISDSITKEINITPNLITFCSLKQSLESWVKELMNKRNFKRENNYSFIVKAGYDIECNAKNLESYYLNVIANKKVE